MGPNPDDGPEPLSLAWPDTCSKRITYVCFLPLVLPLWLTLPDTRKQESRKWFPISFLGSILWIAVFSYLMVWWATISGEAFSIPPEVVQKIFMIFYTIFLTRNVVRLPMYSLLVAELVPEIRFSGTTWILMQSFIF